MVAATVDGAHWENQVESGAENSHIRSQTSQTKSLEFGGSNQELRGSNQEFGGSNQE